jgi:hypothetical protein
MALSVSDTVEAGDQFVIAKGQTRQYRTIGQNTMLAWIKTYFSSPDPITQVFTPSDGATIPMAQNGTNAWLLLKPTGALTTLNISLPSSSFAVDGQVVECSITSQVTAVAITSAGATVKGAPTVLSSDDYFRLKYNAESLTWYKAN